MHKYSSLIARKISCSLLLIISITLNPTWGTLFHLTLAVGGTLKHFFIFSFEHSQHVIWLRYKKINFYLLLSREIIYVFSFSCFQIQKVSFSAGERVMATYSGNKIQYEAEILDVLSNGKSFKCVI